MRKQTFESSRGSIEIFLLLLLLYPQRFDPVIFYSQNAGSQRELESEEKDLIVQHFKINPIQSFSCDTLTHVEYKGKNATTCTKPRAIDRKTWDGKRCI